MISLITDFGHDDWFVGTMKGVILNVAPRATIIDVTHGISRGDVRAGAFALMASYRFFPQSTIHVAVVDPGVGSERRAIAVRTQSYWFVGPDNGILSFALRQEKVRGIYHLHNRDYFLGEVSATFHGRDVFAPVAAHLSRGVTPRRLGPELETYLKLPWPSVVRGRDRIRGEVIYIDRFGNGITNLTNEDVRTFNEGFVRTERAKRIPVGSCYQAVAEGKPVAVPGSSGYLEIAVNGGDASRKLSLKVGSAVTLILAK